KGALQSLQRGGDGSAPQIRRMRWRRGKSPVSILSHISSGVSLATPARYTRNLALLERHGIEYWLFGGWAVDLHAGSVTRVHDDVEIAVWLEDHERIAALLVADGWKHAPEEDEEGYTGYERGTVRLEVAFLARDENGQVYTPLREGRATWP